MVDYTKPTDIDGRVWASSGEIITPSTGEVENGWEVGQEAPAEFFNYWQNRTDNFLVYLNQKGILQWDVNTDYITDLSYCSQNGNLYLAKQDHSGQDPSLDVGEVYWKMVLSSSGSLSEDDLAGILDRGSHTGVQSISTVDGLQDDLDLKENLSNKVTTFASPNDTTYPTTLAVLTLVAGGGSGNYLKTETVGNVITGAGTLTGGRSYDVDSSGGSYTLTLPAPTFIGDFIWLSDLTGSWGDYPVTLDGNGNDIEGSSTYLLNVRYWSGFAVYIGGAYGWVLK